MGEIGMLWRGAKTVENSHFIYCFKNFSLKEKESEKKKKKKKKKKFLKLLLRVGCL